MLVKHLLEQQTLDFAAAKPQILQWVENAVNSTVSDDKLIKFSPFYDVIVNKTGVTVGKAQQMGIDSGFATKWKSTLSQSPWDTDGVWSQQNFNTAAKNKTDGKTYNFYVTVLRQPAKEVAKFLDAMPDLSNRLKKLAEKENIAISFKTHRLMDSFMGHNDSLKVYYYDASKKAVVTEAVRQWANANKIVTAKRTHEHGTDISSAEGTDRKEGTGSHGQRIADTLARSLLETIKKHGKSFSPEQYYQWITKYAIQLIASVK